MIEMVKHSCTHAPIRVRGDGLGSTINKEEASKDSRVGLPMWVNGTRS